MCLGGFYRPTESEREMLVPRAGVVGGWEEGQKGWPPRSLV